jgi:hypothetical protein
MIHSIFISFVFIWITVFVYIKIRHPFWNLQPVFHAYDYWRYTYTTPFLVYPFRPIQTKFCQFSRIKTIPYLDCSPEQKAEFVNLLQCYYIASDQILHTMDTTTLDDYLTGAGEESYVSFCFHESSRLVPDLKPDVLAVISSRACRLFLFQQTTPVQYPVYFIDFQTVKREQPATTLNRFLLQTHEYNQRMYNPNIAVSLLKKEGDLFDGVVPLVEYTTSMYVLQNRTFPALPPHFHIVQVDSTNMNLLMDFLDIIRTSTSPPFSACVFSEIGTLIALLKHQVFFVSCLRKGDKIYAYYFWKNDQTQYVLPEDIAGDTLHLVASFQETSNIDPNGRLFYLGCLHALHKIVKYKPTFRILLIDDMAHNAILHAQWRAKHQAKGTHLAAYYTYNLICPCSPVSPEKCLFLL